MKKQLEDWWMDNDPLDFGQLSAFLATALEEQRKEILSEMEVWAESKRIVNTTGGFGHHMYNGLLAELRTKLNQLKEG